MAILEIEDLDAGYGPIDVLSDIDLSVESGTITGIIGPNGTGKSTLLKSIIGIADVKQGRIQYKDEELRAVQPWELIEIGIAYMPQGDRVFPDMSVRDNLRVGGYIQGTDGFEERLEYVYELYPDLEEKQDAKAESLSGGQQTMLSFGMALMSDPDLILLDEPSAGLAPELVDQMFELVEQLRDEGMPFLIVEQSVRVLLEHSDYVYVIDEGTIRFHGEPSEIRERDDLMEIYLALEG